MRQKHARAAEPRTKRQEPLVEPPLDKRGRREWNKMSDVELLEFAQRVIDENKLKCKSDLQVLDGGLYGAIIKRKKGLIDELKFEQWKRSKGFFKRMDDAQLIEYAQMIINVRNYKKRTDLEKDDATLCNVLRKRRLFGMLIFPEGNRNWKDLDDDELVEHAQKFVDENGIKNRKELFDKDKGLYHALRSRSRALFDRIRFKFEKRNWGRFGTDGLVEHAKKIIDENGIITRGDLKSFDNGLYCALAKRNLLDVVFAEVEAKQVASQQEQLLSDIRECFDAYTSDPEDK